jgi:hypothetical protein
MYPTNYGGFVVDGDLESDALFIGVHNEVSDPSKALRFLGGKVSVYGGLNAGQGDKLHSLCLLAASSPSRPKKALLPK